MEKVTPAYYATNLRALTFGEMMRLGGLVNGLLGFVIGRFMPPQGRELMPTSYEEIEAQRTDIAPHILSVLEKIGEPFMAAGFREIGYQVMPNAPDDSGSIIYLSDCGEIVGLATVAKKNAPETGHVKVGALCSYDREGHCLSVGNSRISLDPAPGNVVHRLPDKAPQDLLPIFRKYKQASRQEFICFRDWPQVRASMEHDDARSFIHRRDVRKLFVPVP
ncbi:hypothetical protein [Cerasicoccus fimbriatus]|uniref:hypothetical protein n=1 Tax=Cerasicoccus fimbriatus TaxID=3014554 RepID=UPI0022B5307D|nr:hypothetical protein [Cerasicoccus sp. TK19100]